MRTIEDLSRAGGSFRALVAGTTPEQLGDPTPCGEWDVRALLNHVVTGTQWFTTMLKAEPPPDRTIDQLGNDPASAFDSFFGAFVDALSEPGAIEGTYEHRAGPVSGDRLARMRINEFLVHGWDLSVATGQSGEFPEDLAIEGLALYHEMLGGRSRETGGAFGLEVSVGPDAAPIERLVAFVGRTP